MIAKPTCGVWPPILKSALLSESPLDLESDQQHQEQIPPKHVHKVPVVGSDIERAWPQRELLEPAYYLHQPGPGARSKRW